MTREQKAMDFMYKFYQHKCVMCKDKDEHLVYMTNADWIRLLKRMEAILYDKEKE